MLGINPITAHSLLHGYVKLAPGAWLAQTGASSATARYVGALAKHASLRTLNVVRRAESVTSLLDAGADVVLVEGDDLAKQAAVAIGDAPLVLIIDGVAGEPVAQLAPLLKTGGQIVSYTARSRQPLSVSILDLIFRGLSVHGYWLNLWLESTPRETGRPDLPRARRPRRRRHPRRSGRGDLRTSRLPRSDRPCRPQRPQRQGALRSRMSAAAAIATPKERPMIVFARGSITNREALAPHREEEMRALTQLKADGVVKAAYRRTAEPGVYLVLEGTGVEAAAERVNTLPFVVQGLMTIDYEQIHEL
jgi:hypothetical protein